MSHHLRMMIGGMMPVRKFRQYAIRVGVGTVVLGLAVTIMGSVQARAVAPSAARRAAGNMVMQNRNSIKNERPQVSTGTVQVRNKGQQSHGPSNSTPVTPKQVRQAGREANAQVDQLDRAGKASPNLNRMNREAQLGAAGGQKGSNSNLKGLEQSDRTKRLDDAGGKRKSNSDL